MIKLVARAFLTAAFAAAVFAGIWLLTVPETWNVMSRWAPNQATLKGARDFLAQNAPDETGAEVLSVEIKEETRQNGTITHWDGNTKYLEPNMLTSKYLRVTSKVDNIVIKGVEINRGNCEPFEDPWTPVPLKFGESTSLFIVCDPIGAKTSTDRGVYTFTW